MVTFSSRASLRAAIAENKFDFTIERSLRYQARAIKVVNRPSRAHDQGVVLSGKNASLRPPLPGLPRRTEGLAPEPRKMSQHDDDAIAAFIHASGVTRCPTACAAPTQAIIAAADRLALRPPAERRAGSFGGEQAA